MPHFDNLFYPLRPALAFLGTLCIAVLAAASIPAMAASVESETPAQTSQWAIGAGALSRQLPYAGADRKNTALPLLFYDSRWLRVSGANAELKLFSKSFDARNELSLNPLLKYEIAGYEADDSPRLSGMGERHSSFWGGAAATWRNPLARLSAEWVADLSNNSKGQKFALQVDRRFTWGALSVTPRLQGQWLDDKYVDYYFGVRPSEARAGRPSYVGKSSMTLETGLRLDYLMNTRHAFFVDVSATRLPDEISSSPLVDRNNVSRIAAGYLYRF